MISNQLGFSQTPSLKLPPSARLTDAISGESFSAEAIHRELGLWQQVLQSLTAKRILFKAQSSVQWAMLDLACLNDNTLLVPVPAYLSDAQWQHIMLQVKPDLIITDLPLSLAEPLTSSLDVRWAKEHGGFQLYQAFYLADRQSDVVIVPGTQK